MTFAEIFVAASITFGLVAFAAYGISLHARIVELANLMARARAQIELLRRKLLDELPKLIKTCEAELRDDHPVLACLRRVRAELGAAPDSARRAAAAERLTQALEELFAATDDRPGLYSNASFQRLSHRVADLENAIAECRSHHDEVALIFNARIGGALERHVARWLSLAPAQPLERGLQDDAEPAHEFAEAKAA